jgi:hypothetical protein
MGKKFAESVQTKLSEMLGANKIDTQYKDKM